jgi:hypothetical protein
VVGDECHIVSGRRKGPRYDPEFPRERLDDQENLILLCRVHHKIVDDQCETYIAEVLRQLKTNHENWVKSALTTGHEVPPVRIRRIKGKTPEYLIRLSSGQEVMEVVGGAWAFSFEHDEPASEEEMELLRNFLQAAQDWGEMWSTLEAGDRVEGTYGMANLLREIEDAGFWVFGGREIHQLEGGVEPPSPWPVAMLRVTRSTSPDIITFDLAGDNKAAEDGVAKDSVPDRGKRVD